MIRISAGIYSLDKDEVLPQLCLQIASLRSISFNEFSSNCNRTATVGVTHWDFIWRVRKEALFMRLLGRNSQSTWTPIKNHHAVPLNLLASTKHVSSLLFTALPKRTQWKELRLFDFLHLLRGQAQTGRWSKIEGITNWNADFHLDELETHGRNNAL